MAETTGPGPTAALQDAGVTPAAPAGGRKTEQLIEGARTVILARGFEGASVDDIAREAGISKATMYRYFPDKSALFAAVMQRDCGRQGDMFCGIEVEGRPLRDVLVDLAGRYIGFVLSPEALRVYRTVVAEADRFPEVGRAFYAAGPDRGRAWLAPVLADAAARGELSLDDPDAAAHRFFALCLSESFLKRVMGVDGPYDAAEIATRAREAADAFLRLHRPD